VETSRRSRSFGGMENNTEGEAEKKGAARDLVATATKRITEFAENRKGGGRRLKSAVYALCDSAGETIEKRGRGRAQEPGKMEKELEKRR